jgi:hypothetical protein
MSANDAPANNLEKLDKIKRGSIGCSFGLNLLRNVD